jgi:hypothetical protein
MNETKPSNSIGAQTGEPFGPLRIHHPDRLTQARLLAEVARRTREPADALPSGQPAVACLLLWRETVYWALSATTPGDPVASDNLAEQWQSADTKLLADAAGGAPFVESMRQLLISQTRQEDRLTPETALHRVGEFSQGLVRRLSEVERMHTSRRPPWLGRVALAAGALLACGLIWLAWPARNLLAGKPYKISSVERSCDLPMSCGNAFFHTQAEDSPWIEYDLGKVTPLHKLEVLNRSDCCVERALPLVVELSLDHTQWREVARIAVEFNHWKTPLQASARYLRLRVDGRSTLHLKGVVVH